MRQITMILVMFFCVNYVFTQNTVNPVVKTNVSYMMDLGGFRYYGFDYSIGGGVKFNDQYSVMLNFNYLKNKRDNISDNFDALQMLTTSLSTSYRFLKKKHIVSPVLELDAGLNVWSNAEGLYVDNNLIIYDKPDYYRYVFLKNSIIGKTKLLLNVNVKSIDFNIGASFNTYFFHVRDIYGVQYYLEKGIGFEAQVLYTFPMKKQPSKKALE